MAIYGRRVDHPATDGGWGYLAVDEQRGYTPPGSMPEHGWAWRWGGRVGKQNSTNVTAYGAAWAADATTGNPGARKGLTAAFPVTTLMIDNASGTNVLAEFTTIWQASSGQRYTIGAVSDAGNLSHGQNADGTKHYRRFSVASPTDPFNYSESSPEGQISFFIEYEPNVAPSTPGSLAPSGLITTATPTMTGTFSDANTVIEKPEGGTLANPLEKLKQYQVEVRRKSDGVYFWQPSAFSASSTEQTNAKFEVAYGGTSLVSGTEYEWRCRVSDQFDTWSSWTAWTAFTVNAGGSVDVSAGTPSGKQETVTPGPFTGVWDHASGLSTNAVEVRIKQGGTVVKTSPTIAKTVADLGTISTTWAETTFSSLSWGVSNYAYEIRARDTGGLWSAWSASRAFSTNTSPTTPTNLSPTNSQASSSPPKLVCKSTDADDTTATGFVTKCRIKSNAGAILHTRSMTLKSGTTDTWEYQTIAGVNEKQRVTITGGPTGGSFTLTFEGQTTAAIAYNATAAAVQSALEALINVGVGNVACTGGPLPGTAVDVEFKGALGFSNRTQMTAASSLTGGTTPAVSVSTVTQGVDGDVDAYATYKWDAYSGDGTLWSGTKTAEANAVKSAEATFVYGEGPAITVTAPAAGATIATSSLDVTWTTTDQQKKRVVLYADGTTTIAYDSGWIVSTVQSHTIPSGSYLNGTAYDLVVMVENSVPLQGQSTIVDIAISYTPPATIAGVAASAELAPNDVDGEETAILVSWQQTAYASPPWNEYLIYRRESGQAFADALLLARIASPTQVTWVDYLPASGQEYVYSVVQNVTQGSDETLSNPAEAAASVSFTGVTLCDARAGGSRRARLRYGPQSGPLRTIPRVRDKKTVKPWGSTKPVVVQTATNYRQVNEEFVVVNDGVTALANVEAVGSMIDNDAELCLRDERSRKLFVDVTDYEERDEWPSHYSIRLVLTEVDYREDID